ncbi:hypothetical protein [Pelistega indica]|uniref:hypothetical protein n=1 Tax=Pelistega indica TaxID=1414851 RepID=UPI0004CE8216|nr:hypothetical protein [Pelistega indica]
MKLFKILCLLIVLCLMAGCASSTTSLRRAPLPVNLAQGCPEIQSLSSNSWDALAQSYIQLVRDYTDCAMRHEAVVRMWGE